MSYLLRQVDLLKAIKRNQNILVNWICIASFFVLSLIILRDLLLSQGFLMWGDNHIPITRVQLDSQLYRSFFSWDAFYSTGLPFISPNAPILHFLIILPFLFLAGSLEGLLKLFLPFVLALPGIGMYYMSYSINNKRKILSFVSGFFYMLNPWTIDRFVAGHIDLLLAYGIIPIVFALVNQSMNAQGQKQNYKILLAGMIGSLVAIQIHMFFILIVIISLYGLISFLFEIKERFKKQHPKVFLRLSIRNKLAPPFLAISIILIINIYFIAPLKFNPLISGSYPSHYPSLEELLLYSAKGNIGDDLRMSTSSINYADEIISTTFGPIYYNLWSAILILFALFIIGYATLKLKLSSLMVLLILLIFMGIIFSVGQDPDKPLSSLYLYLYQHIPFFNAFRDPNKWVALLAFSYSFLLGKSLMHLSPTHVRLTRDRLKSVINKKTILMSVLLFLAGNFALPFFVSPNFRGGIGPIKYPPEYNHFINWLNAQKTEDRIALFPPDFAVKYDWFNPASKCKVCVTSIQDQLYTYPIVPTLELRDPFSIPGKDNYFAWWMYQTLYDNNTKYAAKLFGLTGTKYLVIRNDAHPFSYGGILMVWSNRTIDNYISKQSGLNLVYRNGSISVYENSYALPHIYNANNLTLAVGDRNILNSLAYLNYPLSKYPVLFVNDVTDQQIIRSIPFIKNLVIDIEKYNDLYFGFMNKTYLTDPYDYIGDNQNADKFWVASGYIFPSHPGVFDSELQKFIFTSGKANLTVPISAPVNGQYDIWMRLYKGPDAANLTLTMDGRYIGEYNNYASNYYQGFEWTKLKSVQQLNKGNHMIGISSNIDHSNGVNAISQIALLPANTLNLIKNKVNGIIRDNNIKIIYISEGEKLNFVGDAYTQKVDFEASNGHVLSFRNGTALINTYFPSDGYYTLNLRLANLKDDWQMNDDLRILLNDHPIPVMKYESNSEIFSTGNDFRFIRLTNLHFKQGTNVLQLGMKNGILLDQLYLLPSGHNLDISDNKGEAGFASALSSQDIKKKDQFAKVNPSEYRLKNGSLPITVFLETYNPGWQTNNGYSVPIFSYANAFIHSNNIYTIVYRPEIYYAIGKIVSLVSILILAIFTIIFYKKSLKLDYKIV
jgi:hypothetical protein